MGVVNLRSFENRWYKPGTLSKRLTWMVVSRAIFQTRAPWPSTLKAAILRRFGAKVGPRVVIKPNVNIKYPWNVSIGKDTWIGEGVWIDSLATVTIGSNACVSQGCMIETGNHDWSDPRFGLRIAPVIIEDGAWAAVRSLLLPGSRLRSHAILGGGGVLSGDTDEYTVYSGNPAEKIRQRLIRTEDEETNS